MLLAGLAPAVISFAAGQAAYTLVLLVLFNLLVPVGWKLGLVRIEDVALGGAVSLAVGLLFWPRGATNEELSRALGNAYVDSSGYLAQAVAHAVALLRLDSTRAPVGPRARRAGCSIGSAPRRHVPRGYLAERGTKTVPLAEVTALVTGVAGLRLAADAVLDLWNGDGQPQVPTSERAAARHELVTSAEHLTAWYDHFAASLAGVGAVPDPLPADAVAGGRPDRCGRRSISRTVTATPPQPACASSGPVTTLTPHAGSRKVWLDRRESPWQPSN